MPSYSRSERRLTCAASNCSGEEVESAFVLGIGCPKLEKKKWRSALLGTPAHDHRKIQPAKAMKLPRVHLLRVENAPCDQSRRAGKLSSSKSRLHCRYTPSGPALPFRSPPTLHLKAPSRNWPSNTKRRRLTAISLLANLHASPNPTTKGAGTVPLLSPLSWPPPLMIGSILTLGRRRT
jgi:hypothetical protein